MYVEREMLVRGLLTFNAPVKLRNLRFAFAERVGRLGARKRELQYKHYDYLLCKIRQHSLL